MGAHTYMSKNISVSDDVYRRLKREKGDRSFSEVIEDHLESGCSLTDVTGNEIFASGTHDDDVRDEIELLSEGTLERVDDETV